MTPFHGFVYGTSRAGKTTIAAHCAKAGMKLLVVTREPGPASAALGASAYSIVVPQTPDELFVLLRFFKPYLDKHLAGYRPDLVLFDNIQGLQQLIVGTAATPAQVVAGLTIPAQEATGIMKNPVARAAGETGQPAQMDYGTLARKTRDFLNLVEALPCSTLLTATEALEFDEKYRKETAGMDAKIAAGRPRKVKGYPAIEGKKTHEFLNSTVSGFVVHLVRKGGKYIMHTQEHADADGVIWVADPRGRPSTLPNEIDWTNKSAYDILLGGG